MDFITLSSLKGVDKLRGKNETALRLLRSFLLAHAMGRYKGRLPNGDQAVLMVKVLRICMKPMKLTEIIESLDCKLKRTCIKNTIVKPLLDMYLMHMTCHSNPRNCNQRYFTSLSGVRYLS